MPLSGLTATRQLTLRPQGVRLLLMALAIAALVGGCGSPVSFTVTNTSAEPLLAGWYWTECPAAVVPGLHATQLDEVVQPGASRLIEGMIPGQASPECVVITDTAKSRVIYLPYRDGAHYVISGTDIAFGLRLSPSLAVVEEPAPSLPRWIIATIVGGVMLLLTCLALVSLLQSPAHETDSTT